MFESLPTISTHEVLLMFHILGTILGVGGATISDIIFLRSTKDGVIQKKEWDILRYVSFVIWVGLIVAIASGVGFLLENSSITENPKVLAKLTIIGIIFFNGVFLHWRIFPLISSMIGKKMQDTQFVNNMTMVFTSGAISISSWYVVFILGAWRGLNNTLTYWEILLVYSIILVISIIVSNLIGRIHAKKIITIYTQHKE